MIDLGVERRLITTLGATARRLMGFGPVENFYRSLACIAYHHGVWRAGQIELEMFGGVTLDRLRADLELLQRYFDFVPLSRLLEARAQMSPGPSEPSP